jgi:hypothetical protein
VTFTGAAIAGMAPPTQVPSRLSFSSRNASITPCGHLPVYTVAGAALMGTLVTSVAGVAFYQAIAPLYPEMSLQEEICQ